MLGFYSLKIKHINLFAFIWLAFLLILTILSSLPHWPTIFLSWFNTSLYFLLFLICFFIFINDRYLKIIFISFSITYFLYSLSIVTIFIGEEYVFGSNRLIYSSFVYRKIILDSLSTFSILILTGNYIFKNVSPIVRTTAAALIVTILNWIFIRQFLDFSILQKEGIPHFYIHMIPLNIAALVFLLAYGFIYLVYRRPNGKYLHQLVALLSLFKILHLLDYIEGINSYGYDQYFLMITLFLMVWILYKRYLALQSDKYLLWERLIFDQSYLADLKITSHNVDVTFPSLVFQFPWNWSLKVHLLSGLVLLLLAFLFRSIFVTVKLITMVVWLAILLCIVNISSGKIRELGVFLNFNSLKHMKLKKEKT